MQMHLYYFTPDTLTRMLRAAGFRIVAIERHQRVISLRYLVEKLAALWPPMRRLGPWLGHPLGGVFVTLDLVDIMHVYAQRPPESS